MELCRNIECRGNIYEGDEVFMLHGEMYCSRECAELYCDTEADFDDIFAGEYHRELEDWEKRLNA